MQFAIFGRGSLGGGAVLSRSIGDTTRVSWLLMEKVAADGGEIAAFEIEEAPGDVEGVVPEVGLKRDAKAAGMGVWQWRLHRGFGESNFTPDGRESSPVVAS